MVQAAIPSLSQPGYPIGRYSLARYATLTRACTGWDCSRMLQHSSCVALAVMLVGLSTAQAGGKYFRFEPEADHAALQLRKCGIYAWVERDPSVTE